MTSLTTFSLGSLDLTIRKEKAKSYEGLMSSFTDTKDDFDFVSKLKEYQSLEWKRSKDDLFAWIPVLNRLDNIFKEIVEEHHLEITIPNLKDASILKKEQKSFNTEKAIIKKSVPKYNGSTSSSKSLKVTEDNIKDNNIKPSYDAFLTLLPSKTENLILDMLNFTVFLLENTTGRSVYSSIDRMLSLLNAPNIKIKLGCMKVLAINASRNFKSWAPNKLIKTDVMEKSLIIALSLLCFSSIDSGEETTFNLFQFLSKFSPNSFDLPNVKELNMTVNNFLPFSFKYYSEKNDTFEVFKLSKDKILKTTYEDLLNTVKQQQKIPEHYWFKLSIELYLLKTFVTSKRKISVTDDNQDLHMLFESLNPFIQLKFYCVGLINCLVTAPKASSILFELDGNIFDCLCNLTLCGYPLQPERNGFSLADIRHSALFALECISSKQVWCLDILKCIGGNVSHGSLFMLLERLRFALADGQNADLKYNILLFSLLMNLSSVSSINDALVSSGLIRELTKILSLPGCTDYITLVHASTALKNSITTFELTSIFQAVGGYKFLVDRLQNEIDFCIANPNMNEGVEYYTKVYYTIPFNQLSFLRSVLKQLLNTINLDSSDRTRNLMDSSILDTLNKMLLNKNVFGYTLISYVLNIIQTLLNKEPTIFQVLQETGTISIIMDNFADFIGPWPNLLLTLPQIVSAICLNKDALKEVIKKNIIHYLFEPLRNVELAKGLANDMDTEYGGLLDELYRHHPELQQTLEDEFVTALNKFDRGEYVHDLFMTDTNGNFFDSQSETWISQEVPDSLASVYDYTDVGILTKMAVLTLYSCNWKNMIQRLDLEYILNSIFKEGIPFSFTYSDTYVAITDVIKGSDVWDTEATLMAFMKIIMRCFDNLSKFMNHDNEKSFFLSADKSDIIIASQSLNLLYSVLHVLVYSFFGTEAYSHLTVFALITTRRKNDNIECICQLLGNLFARMLKENTLIQDILTPQQDSNSTPVKVHLIDIRKDKSLKSTTFQESFINNCFVVRTWFYGIQISTASIFKSLLRTPLVKKNNSQGYDKYLEVCIMETVMKTIVSLLKFLNDNGEVHEILIGLYHIKCALSKNAIGYQGLHRYIEFPAASLFYREKGNQLLFKLILKVLNLMYDKSLIEFYDIDYAKVYNRDIKSLAPKTIEYCFSLLAWTTNVENCELDQNKFEQLFRNVMTDSSSYCQELMLETKTINSSELKNLFTKERLQDIIFDDKNKLSDHSFISLLEFILSLCEANQLPKMSKDDSKGLTFLHSDYTNYFNAFKTEIKRPEDIKNDDLWNDICEDLLYSYDNGQENNINLMIGTEYPQATKQILCDYNMILNNSPPFILFGYVDKSSFANEILVNNIKSILQKPDSNKIIDTILDLLKIYPNCTINLAGFYEETKQILSKEEKDNEKHSINILPQLADEFSKFKKIQSSWLHFMSVILANTRLDRSLTDVLCEIETSLRKLIDSQLSSDCISSDWTPYFLFLYEQLLTYSMVPEQDVINDYSLNLPLKIDQTFRLKVFQLLLRFKNIKTVELGYSITRILLLYSRDLSLLKEIVNSQILSEILKCIGVSQKDSLVGKLQTLFIILSRACFENEVVIENIMMKDIGELNKSLPAFILNKTYLIFRNEELILKALKKKHAVIHNNWIESNKFLSEEEKKNNTKPIEEHLTLENKTGVIYLLFSQLMASFKKDWLSEDDNIGKEDFDIEKSNNKVFNYIKFLLSTLCELVTAYKQSKLEMLTFSKRNVVDQIPKPRFTSINFLLYQLLPVINWQTAVEYKKKFYLSSEAKRLIESFMELTNSDDSFLILPASEPVDEVEDPDLTFLRKHVIESIIKFFTNSTRKQNSQFMTESERLKVNATVNLVSEILSRNLKDEKVKKFLAKIMIDLDLPNTISLLMNKIDISLTKEAADTNMSIINCLYLIQSIIDSDVDYFKVDDVRNLDHSDDDQQQNESEIDLSDDNNMFKNSALAMYDIEDIEEEVMDDESLFDEELDDEDDVAFVDNEALEGSLELLSADEDDDRDHNRFDPMIDSEADVESEDVSMEDDEILAEASDENDIETGDDDDDDEDDDDDGVIYLDNEGIILDDDGYIIDSLDEEVGVDEFNSFNDQELYDTDLNDNYEDDESSSFSFNEDGLVGQDSAFTESSDDPDNYGENSDDGIMQYQITPGVTRTIDLSSHRQRHQPIGFTRRNSILGSPSDFLGTIPAQFDSLAMETLGIDLPGNDPSTGERTRGTSLRNRALGMGHILSNAQDLHRNQGQDGSNNTAPSPPSASYYLSSFFHRSYSKDTYVTSAKRWEQVANMFFFEKSLFLPIKTQIVKYLNEDSINWKQRSDAEEEKNKQITENKMFALKRKASEAGLNDHLTLNRAEGGRRRTSAISAHEAVLSESESDEEVNHQEIEPIFVDIGGNQINIAGTDIDAEYLMALPENMREEVFYHHVAEDRARRLSHGDTENNGVRVGYLASLPSQMRNRILAAQIRYETEDEDDEDGEEQDYNGESFENSARESHNHNNMNDFAKSETDEKNSKIVKATPKTLPPLLERVSVFSIIKSFFIYQPYMKRENQHSFFEKLCATKSNRNEFLNLLILIIAEGISSKNALTKIFNFICNKIEQLSNPNDFTPKNYQLPINCLYTNVASQCIDCLSHLVNNTSIVKLFLASNHDSLLVVKHKKYLSTKGDVVLKSFSTEQVIKRYLSECNKSLLITAEDLKLNEMEEKCPLNYLINSLFIPVVGEELTLMDSLTKIIQLTFKAHTQLKKKSAKYQGHLMDKAHKILTSSIILESSTTRGLQNILMTLVSLKLSDPTKEHIIVNEFIELANNHTGLLQQDLKELTENVSNFNDPFGSNLNRIISKLSSSSSSQAILLKCTTSIDYIFFEEGSKKKAEDINIDALKQFYSQMHLTNIWSMLTDFLNTFENEYDTSANVNKISFLLPLLEALMIICKITIYNKKQEARDSKTIELSIFCNNFISKHKILLNSMIKTTPKLMNGPFSILLKLDSSAIDFDNKRFYFVDKLKQEVLHDEHGTHKEIPVDISRDQVFLDSYRVLFFKPIKDFTISKFNINFQGEQGVDAGGVKREWYQIISRQMVNPDYALFVPVSSDASTFHPNRTSGINPEHLSFFKFIGMILAKSIRDNCYIDSHFSRAVYKQILGKNVSLKDMESIDPDYYKSLCWILENDITDVLEMTFSVETDDYGEHKIIDLIPNGSNIEVTESNKKDYVERMTTYKLKDSVKEQMDNLIQGFYSVISKENIKIFNEKELELLMNGLPEIDVDDWKNNTTYINYSTTSKEINYFWRAVRSFSKDERAKLLQFITGTSKVPLDGFKQLAGVNGTSKFSIHKDFGSDDRLPQSHTCFNQLDLPSYKSYDDLKRALLIAINEGYEGFGLK